jgi:cbb3-type cytochrome oxidase subunit 3
MRHAMEWWPTIWMSVVYVAVWAMIIWLAAKALTERRGRRRH